jgi:hypothetical protein
MGTMVFIHCALLSQLEVYIYSLHAFGYTQEFEQLIGGHHD